MRNTIFANDEYYHIFNRGVEKRDVFSDAKDYERFLLSMNILNDQRINSMIDWRDYKKYNKKSSLDDFLKLRFRSEDRQPYVEIIAYCLNPNHYHFILKQVSDKGIEKFMHKIGISHTKYYNKKHERSGVLFQGVFKAIHIDSNEYLLYLSAYVNKNNFIHGYNKDDRWPYSSLHHYLGKTSNPLVHENVVLSQLGNRTDYKTFLEKNALHMRNKKELSSYLIEE